MHRSQDHVIGGRIPASQPIFDPCPQSLQRRGFPETAHRKRRQVTFSGDISRGRTLDEIAAMSLNVFAPPLLGEDKLSECYG